MEVHWKAESLNIGYNVDKHINNLIRYQTIFLNLPLLSDSLTDPITIISCYTKIKRIMIHSKNYRVFTAK